MQSDSLKMSVLFFPVACTEHSLDTLSDLIPPNFEDNLPDYYGS